MKALLIVNPVSGKRRITGELVEIISRLENILPNSPAIVASTVGMIPS